MFALILLAIISLLAYSNFSESTAAIIILTTIFTLVVYSVMNARSQKKKKMLEQMKPEDKN